MQGSFLLVAFALGFWGFWSANRDPNSLMEALTITVIAIIARALMEWSGIPDFNNVMLTSWGLLWIYSVVVIELVGRYSVNFGANCAISVGGATGWYFLAQYIFSPAGAEMIKGFVG